MNTKKTKQIRRYQLIIAGEVVLVVLLTLSLLFDINLSVKKRPVLAKFLTKTRISQEKIPSSQPAEQPDFEAAVLPAEGVELPITWGDLGKKMTESGVIDQQKFEDLYQGRGGLDDDMLQLLVGDGNKTVRMTQENSAVLLNFLWAFGLANKNDILEKGPMQDPQYGGAGNFASTGGWSLARGNAMDHYSNYQLVTLTREQQQLVERVSQGIYRPCCGNSTYFPDCNHGMAMLGLLELMAAGGVSEDDMYRVALKVNSYWFPDTYLTAAKYFQTKGIDWNQVDPREALGADVSSAQGYRKIRSQVEPPQSQGGGGCGV